MSKILLVEDDNNLREIYEARLMAEGYTIVTAPDGEAALAIASQEKPDLVISDVMMPNISGFDMLDIMRNTEGLRNVHVIMLTALSQAEDQARADALGADRYLVKSQVTLEDIVNNAKVLLGDNDAAPAPEAPAAVESVAPAVAAPVAAAPIVANVPVAAPPEPAQVSLPEPVLTDTPVQATPVVTEPPVAPEPTIVTPVPEPVAPAPEPTVVPEPPAAAPEPIAAEPVAAPQPDPVAPTPTADPVVAEPTAIQTPTTPAADVPVPQSTVAPTQPIIATEPVANNELSETLAQEEADIQAQIDAFAAAPIPGAPVAQETALEPIQQPTPVENATPAPEPVAAPQPDPVAPTPTADPVVAEPTQQETAVQEPVVTPPAPVAEPQPTATPVTENSQSNDALISNAVDQLNAGVQAAQQSVAPQQPLVVEPTMPVTPPAPEPQVIAPQTAVQDPSQNPASPAPAGPVVPRPASDGGTKVIQPINDPNARPDINQLLAAEEAKESNQGNVLPPSIGQQPNGSGSNIRPEDIAL